MNTFWKVVAAFFITIIIGLVAYVIRFSNGPDRFSQEVDTSKIIIGHTSLAGVISLAACKRFGEVEPTSEWFTTNGNEVVRKSRTAEQTSIPIDCLKWIPNYDYFNAQQWVDTNDISNFHWDSVISPDAIHLPEIQTSIGGKLYRDGKVVYFSRDQQAVIDSLNSKVKALEESIDTLRRSVHYHGGTVHFTNMLDQQFCKP